MIFYNVYLIQWLKINKNGRLSVANAGINEVIITKTRRFTKKVKIIYINGRTRALMLIKI